MFPQLHPSFVPGLQLSSRGKQVLFEVDIGCDQKSGIRDKVLLEKLPTFSVVGKSPHKTPQSHVPSAEVS